MTCLTNFTTSQYRSIQPGLNLKEIGKARTAALARARVRVRVRVRGEILSSAI